MGWKLWRHNVTVKEPRNEQHSMWRYVRAGKRYASVLSDLKLYHGAGNFRSLERHHRCDCNSSLDNKHSVRQNPINVYDSISLFVFLCYFFFLLLLFRVRWDSQWKQCVCKLLPVQWCYLFYFQYYDNDDDDIHFKNKISTICFELKFEQWFSAWII